MKKLILAAILAAAGVSIGRGALQSVIHRSYLTAAAPGGFPARQRYACLLYTFLG